MKVIDLLNKIANGEHNFSFKYGEDEFFYDFDSKRFVDTRFKETLGERYSLDMMLNDEVEVIEEDKKIEKIDLFDNYTGYNWSNRELCEQLERNFIELNSKINEIIDKINKEK